MCQNTLGHGSQFLDADEVLLALTTLLNEQWSRLLRRADYFSGGTEYEPLELLQEACTQALEQRRKCRRNLMFSVFFNSTMRSIAHNSRRGGYLLTRVELDFSEEEAPLEEIDLNLPSVEDLLISAECCARIEADGRFCLRNDPQATALLELLLEERDRAEILSRLGMSNTAYDSLRRRYRRKTERTAEKLARQEGS